VQQPIVRTYRGATPDAAAAAYRTDAARAQATGYVPISHRWAEDDSGHVLTVAFQLRAAAEPQPEPQPQPGPEPEPQPEPKPEPKRQQAQPAAGRPEDDFESLVGLTPQAAGLGPSAAAAPPTRRAPATREAVTAGRNEVLAVQVLDMHCAGEPLRIVRSGFPEVPMLSVLERRRWIAKNADHVRRAIIDEPRGHRDMYGAVLLPPYSPDVDICLLFMHNAGYSTMCGHGVIAVTTALIEEGLYPATSPVTTIRYEVPAGVVAASATVTELPDGGHAVGGVRFTNVPSYLGERSLALRPDGVELHGRAAEAGHLAVDVAFGGAYYGIVDAAQLGLRVVPEQASLLRHAGAAITEVLRRDHTPAHPTDDDLSFVYGTIIVDLEPSTSPDGLARDAHIRNATVFADAELDRSPCGSGTSAILAQLHGRGRMQVGQEIANASITGERFYGRIESETRMGGQPAIVTSIAGTAYVTGYGTLVVDERDPLGDGFLLS
jgi:proline racemase